MVLAAILPKTLKHDQAGSAVATQPILTVGSRELKNRLTHYLRLTQKGERIIVTDHGKPVAILHDLTQVEVGASAEERLATASIEGIVRLPRPGASLNLKAQPVSHRGRAAAEILLEDRD